MNAFELNAKLIREIKPSMSYEGKNLEEWQRTAKAKLAELLGMDKFTKVAPELDIEYEKKIDGATEIRFTFQSEDGYRVPCHLLLPDGAVEVYEEGRRAYTDSGNSDRCALVKGDIPGNGGHRFYADDAWPVVHKLIDR